jgi:hypothetical protein
MATILETYNEVHKAVKEGTSRYSNPDYRAEILRREAENAKNMTVENILNQSGMFEYAGEQNGVKVFNLKF